MNAGSARYLSGRCRALLLVACLCAASPAQVLEGSIRLPTLFTGVVARYGRKLYLSSHENSVGVLVVDCSTRVFTRAIPVLAAGYIPDRAAWDWRRGLLYARHRDSAVIAVVDMQTDSVIDAIQPGQPAVNLSFAYDSRDDRLYAVGSRICAFDCRTRTLTDSIDVNGCSFAAWDSVDNKLYTGSGFGWSGVRVVDCATNTVKLVIPTSITPEIELTAYDAAFDRLYLCNENDYFSGVINCSNDSYTRLRVVGLLASPPACNDREGKVYWPSEFPNGDTLVVMNMSNDSVLRKVRPRWRGSTPRVIYAAALAPWSNRLYFTWGVDDSSGQFYPLLSVLDCETDSILGTIEVPRSPAYLYCNPYDQRVYLGCVLHDSCVCIYRDEPVGAVEAPAEVAPIWTLSVGPNPASGRVRVSATVPAIGEAAVSVYDASGRLVRVLSLTRDGQNELEAVWDATDGSVRVPAGVYVIRLDAGAIHRSQKVVLTAP